MTSGGMAGGVAFDPAVPGLAPWGLYGSRGAMAMASPAGFRIQALGASRGTVTWPIAPRRHANTRRMTSSGMAGGVAFIPAVPGLAPWGLYGCKGRGCPCYLAGLASEREAGCRSELARSELSGLRYRSAAWRISAGWRAWRPVPSAIWWRQLVPGAARSTSAGAARTAGKSTSSPILIDTSKCSRS